MDPFDLKKWPKFWTSGGKENVDSIIYEMTIDSRLVTAKNSVFIALLGKKTDGHQFIEEAIFKGAKFIVVKKGWIPLKSSPQVTYLSVEDPLKALQEIASLYRQDKKAKVIGIAGSFGKTMVKDLLFLLLSEKYRTSCSPESFNSQIGVPLSLLRIKEKDEIALIEASVSCPGEMESLKEMISPNIGIVTPIGRKHEHTLGTFQEQKKEIFQLFKTSSCQDFLLVKDSSFLSLESFFCPTFFWGEETPSLPFCKITRKTSSKFYFSIHFPNQDPYEGSISKGFSYLSNLLNIAVKAAYLLGVQKEEIQKVLQKYEFSPMRQEIWASNLPALFINDTYSSDPQSIDRSLPLFSLGASKKRKVFVFGGLREKDSSLPVKYEKIGKSLIKMGIDHLFLYGSHNFSPLKEQMKKSGILVQEEKTVFSCLQAVKKKLLPGDTILMKGEEKIPFDLVLDTFQEESSPNQCIINLAKISSNLRFLRKKLSSHTTIMVIIKAFAYGTDPVRMAKFFLSEGISILGVSSVNEAIQLRKEGIDCPIFVIHFPFYEAKKIIKWDLEAGVSDLSQIEALEKEALSQTKKIKIHLHVDTGMHRFGCKKEEAEKLAKKIENSSSLILQGVMTHLASADDPEQDGFTLHQMNLFKEVVLSLKKIGVHPPFIHAANSSGALRFQFADCNMVRIGLAAYGLYSSKPPQNIDLHLSISLVSRIVALSTCKKGDTISYGRKFVIEKETQTIAVLPIGYHDGLHRHYSGKGYVLVRGKKAAMIGTICMDFMMIDVSDIDDVSVGDSVLIFGEDEWGHFLSPEEFASSGNSIAHELITCLGPRIERIFVFEESHSIR